MFSLKIPQTQLEFLLEGCSKYLLLVPQRWRQNVPTVADPQIPPSTSSPAGSQEVFFSKHLTTSPLSHGRSTTINQSTKSEHNQTGATLCSCMKPSHLDDTPQPTPPPADKDMTSYTSNMNHHTCCRNVNVVNMKSL